MHQPNDFMVGGRTGGIDVFGDGLAVLYDASHQVVGGVGVSGDTSCTDHMIAWRTRNDLGLDHLTGVGGVTGDPAHPDNIIFSPSGSASIPTPRLVRGVVFAHVIGTSPRPRYRIGMRPLFEPHLVHEAFGDPGLYVDFRDERRALLFDLGDIGVLPPRKLMRLSHVFVTHTHMDHFSGFDHWLRVVLGRKAEIVMFGGPRFIEQVEHKLLAYTWNVVHRYEIELVIDAREIDADGRGRRCLFSSRTRFAREDQSAFHIVDGLLHEEATFRVRCRFVDHDVPCIAYALEEKAHVNVAKDRLAALGVSTGAWLRELKHAVLSGAPESTPIRVEWRDREGNHAMTRTTQELRHLILDIVPGRRIGYATDLRYTEANVGTLAELFSGVDILFIESVFLDEDADQAAWKNHLTARQAGEIAHLAGAKSVVPFHFSPRYQGRESQLEAEMRSAWMAAPAQREA